MPVTEPLGLHTINAVPLHERVYREIIRALMSGQLEPGQKLTSRKLAHELGISDMPVRSAFMRLQALRALNAQPNGSMEVPRITAEEFHQLTEMRYLLEGDATRRAASRLNGNNLRKVRRLCSELTEAARSGNIEQYLEKNLDFKFSIYLHCGNEPLVFFIETLWMRIGPFLRNFSVTFDDDLSAILEIDYHENALTAIEKRDGDAAADAIIQDIREGAEHLLGKASFG